ncbi:uncharacterized protein At4g15970 isoform X2 [Brachypodium distachyon]|nr:uncharacterized protein At4g15970 isoform X2 [Brachypodium distachyon]|eukprot:XP_024310762.1 uncharacterized protein At4g15970 isoform X2 [Brachypodium distachyon]
MLLSPSSCPGGPDQKELGFRNGTQADRNIGMATAARKDDDGLAELLRSAAMENNVIILTFTNEAWTAPGSLLDLFLESFRIGVNTQPLLKHLVIVAADVKAFERCQRVHPLCHLLLDTGGGGAKFAADKAYMSPDYLEMMWVRNKFQTRVLELGYTFVFTDVDMVWFRNPLLRIPVGADIAISCDRYKNGEEPYDLRKEANGGFLYARPNNRTLGFFVDWYEARTRYTGLHDQHVFEKVKDELSRRHGAAVQFVDTAYFGGFCEPKMDFRKLCTFHGNCLKGLGTKMGRLRDVLGEWKQFRNGTHPK